MLYQSIKTKKIYTYWQMDCPTIEINNGEQLYREIYEREDVWPCMFLSNKAMNHLWRLEKYWRLIKNGSSHEPLNWYPDEHHLQCPACKITHIMYDAQLESFEYPICSCSAIPDYGDIYNINFTAHFKKKIKVRDNYTCQICGTEDKKDRICVHHINYDKDNDCSDPKDFLTVCNACNLSLNHNRLEQTSSCKKIIAEIYSS